VAENRRVVTLVRLPEDLWKRVDMLARAEGQTFSQAVETLLRATFIWGNPAGSEPSSPTPVGKEAPAPVEGAAPR
jgi:hypothetical protein